MKARIYVNNQLVGEATVTMPDAPDGHPKHMALADNVVVAFFEDHAPRGMRPLQARGLIEHI
jgi:hypothetical protein